MEEEFMRQIKCPDCNEKCIKHGVLKSGSQRWFCKHCKVAFTVKINNLSKSDFLREMTIDEFGNKRSTHERLLKAESSLWRLIRQQTLFTFLECIDITVPTTNNRIEGGVNAQLRSMLRSHRGLSLERRLKAVYWWCYMHSPRPLSISDILNCMPTDESIAAIYKRLSNYCQIDRSIPQWGDAPVWNELHMSTDFPTYWD